VESKTPASDLRRKLRWLIGIRAVISTVLLGSATFAQITAPGSFPVNPFFFLIGLTYALTACYAATLRLAESRRWIVDVQLAGDALIVSAFIYFTGGITSYFTSLYVLPIVAASVVQFRRGGLLVATLSAVLYGGVVLTQYLTAAGYVQDPWLVSPVLPPRSVAQYTYLLNAFGFFAVALLSGSLADRVRATGARLEQASNQIADLQALNQHVIDSLPSGLATTDNTGRVLTFNRAAENITGRSSTSVAGRPIAEVLHIPEDAVGALTPELDGGRARRMESHFMRGGQHVEIGLSIAYLETPGGRAGYLVTFQDVTDIKKLERGARLQQRLAAVGEMAAGIAHEIRNPLASMRGSIQVLRAELDLSDEQARLMDIVMRESDRLNDTIRSFLSYARPQPLAAGPVDAGRLLRDTAILLRNSPEVLAAHRIDVDAPDAGPIVDGDDGQIRQVVWNLATNGLRAMPEGGRLVLRARGVEATETGETRVAIEVADEGVGIAPDQLDTLFQPFRGSFPRGSGLGLAIVHRIVSDHRGEVRVESEVARGTTVTVRLPAKVMELTAGSWQLAASG
jgi:two-component system, NtrC family, sensor histidine kinase PilS